MKTDSYILIGDWYKFDMVNHIVSSEKLRKMIQWCSEHFGDAPKWGAYPGAPDAWTRWCCTGSSFKFRDEEDYAFFLLRWA
jgi:hypothetical protein